MSLESGASRVVSPSTSNHSILCSKLDPFKAKYVHQQIRPLVAPLEDEPMPSTRSKARLQEVPLPADEPLSQGLLF